MGRRGMPKRRYYYDRKGNLTGSSSDTYLATPKGFAGLVIMLMAIAIGNALFGNGESGQSNTNEQEMTETKSEPAGVGNDPGLTTSERSETEATYNQAAGEEKKAESETKASAPSDTQRLIELPTDGRPARYTRSRDTEAYMQRTYVDGNPDCPREIVSFQIKECRAGDEQVCQSLKNTCGPSFEKEVGASAPPQ